MSVLMALLGAAILIFAGDMLVRGAVALSLRLGLSLALIGLTVVAFGTSAPELVICIQAALDDAPDIAVGNVVGSNVANIMLVVGLAAMIVPIRDGTSATFRNYIVMIGASLALMIVAPFGGMGRAVGALFVLLLVLAMWSAYRGGRQQPEELDEYDTDSLSLPKTVGLLVVGLAGLPLGAHLLIEGAQEIARALGVSEAAIGLTLVALGTSLPEVAATVMAAMRGRTEMALSNAIGSNLFNVLGILGLTAVVKPIEIADTFLHVGIPIMLATSLVLLPFLWLGNPIGRVAGVALSLGYAAIVYVMIGT